MELPSHSKFSDDVSLHRVATALMACVILVSAGLFFSPVSAASAGDPVKGQALFTKNSCVVCHAGGENTMEPAHPIKGAAFQQKYKDDAVLETTIRNGFPQYGMPSFNKAMINDNDMKDLVAYVRTLSKPAKNTK